MVPIRSVKNQYRGINAHLHSFWQAEHKWNRFHNVHIADLVQRLRMQLIPMGYTAEVEESLQIRRLGDDQPRMPRADILILDTTAQINLPSQLNASYEVQPVLLEELIEAEDLEYPFHAIAIYDMAVDEVVGWIELLSPSNKGFTKDAFTYLAKRRLMIEGGTVFVEIDYLHETPPTFEKLSDYSEHQPDAHPYRIMVLDPRVDPQHTLVFPYPFIVDMPIPTTIIPLKRNDKLIFDFNQVYQQTYEQMLYGVERNTVDYTQLPLNFDRYSPADQRRIANRMLTVIEAARRGDDLEVPPQPIETPIPLDEALKRVEALRAISG